MRKQRNEEVRSQTVGALKGRRNSEAAPNSMKFLVEVEGVEDFDGHVRGANGIRWRLA